MPTTSLKDNRNSDFQITPSRTHLGNAGLKSGSGSNVSCFAGHEHAEHCSYPFGPGMGCHRMGRESRSPVHVTCQQRSSSQIATTGSLWPAMRTRTGVFTGAIQIGLHPGSPEAGPCKLVRGKANTPALVTTQLG